MCLFAFALAGIWEPGVSFSLDREEQVALGTNQSLGDTMERAKYGTKAGARSGSGSGSGSGASAPERGRCALLPFDWRLVVARVRTLYNARPPGPGLYSCASQADWDAPVSMGNESTTNE